MAELKWIKIATNMYENPKIIAIESKKNADGILVIWSKIICFAGKINNSGLFTLNGTIPYDEKMIANAIHRNEKKVKEAFCIFIEYGMVEKFNGVYSICNWEKYQATDKIEKLNADNSARQKRYRENKKQKINALSNGVNDVTNDVTVTHQEVRSKKKDIEVLQKESIEKVANAPLRAPKVFTRPTLEEVKAYCLERGNKVDPEQWMDYYTSKGWLIGKTPMKDWKAAVRTWENNGIDNKQNGKPSNGAKIDWMDDYIKGIQKGA